MGFILSERRKKALQRHCIVGVIDKKSELIADLYHLDPASDVYLKERLLDLLRSYAEVSADRDRAERVVNAEAAGSRYFRAEFHKAFDIKRYAKFARLFDQSEVLRVQIRGRCKTVRLYTAGMTVADPLIIGIVRVEDANFALPEQKTLAIEIIVEVLVLIGTDVVGRQVGEDTVRLPYRGRSSAEQWTPASYYWRGSARLHRGSRSCRSGRL